MPGPSPLHAPSRRRRGEGNLSAVAIGGAVIMIAVAYLGFTFGPVWFDFLAVQEVCRTVVLDWASHENEASARSRFDMELRRKNVSEDIQQQDCDFIGTSGAWEVDCSWTQYAYYPGTDYFKKFPLRVDARYVDGKAELIPH